MIKIDLDSLILLNDDLSFCEPFLLDKVKSHSGEWLLIVPANALVNIDIFDKLIEAIQKRPEVSIWYADELTINQDSSKTLIAKPEFDLSMLMSSGYIGFPLIIRKNLIEEIGLPNPAFLTARWVHFCMKAHFHGCMFGRVSEIFLTHLSGRVVPKLTDRMLCLKDIFSCYAPHLYAEKGLTDGSVSIWRRFQDYPDVTIVIPTCQSRGSADHILILDLLNSLEKTLWQMDRITVIVGDDTLNKDIFDRSWPFTLIWQHTPRDVSEPFNYAKKMNELWRMAKSDFIVLMNDDMWVIHPLWLQALATFALEEDVGVAGAKLLFPSGLLQHAGVIIDRYPMHAWYNISPENKTYEDWAVLQKEWSLLTGALFATRKSILEDVGGFDERFVLEYNDFDMCLRIKTLGYRLVYTPFAELIHHEQASRAYIPKDKHRSLFMSCWKDSFVANDPCFSPLLVIDEGEVVPKARLELGL
ncbi:MAG: glycosyltransferase [Gammaproteobacteria bacterium]